MTPSTLRTDVPLKCVELQELVDTLKWLQSAWRIIPTLPECKIRSELEGRVCSLLDNGIDLRLTCADLRSQLETMSYAYTEASEKLTTLQNAQDVLYDEVVPQSKKGGLRNGVLLLVLGVVIGIAIGWWNTRISTPTFPPRARYSPR